MDRSEILHKVEVGDIVTHAKLGDDRFSHFCMGGGRISGFPIDLCSCSYNSRGTTVPECNQVSALSGSCCIGAAFASSSSSIIDRRQWTPTSL